MIKDNQALSHIHSEGSLLSRDFLLKLLSGNGDIPAFLPKDYHLSGGERLNEAATRSYARLSRLWKSFQAHLKTLPPENSGTTETRNMWLIPLFQELGYGSLQSIRGESIEGKSYPQSHEAQEPLALHLMSHKWELDRRPRSPRDNSFILSGSPFNLMQEYLNRNQKKLWGILTNGRSLRLMRNNASLTRSSYVEFDLEAIFDSDSYADFFLLWLVCHQSRFEVSLDEFNYPLPAETCIMESWYLGSINEGVRAMEELRDKVENSISILGKGFITHAANNELRNALRSGELSPTEFYHQLLRLVYRLIFIFVAEDRSLLLLPNSPDIQRELYERYYSSLPLRKLARRQRGGKAYDLWLQLSLIFSSLYHGNAALGIPALGSFLFKIDPALINTRLNLKFPEYTDDRNLLSTPHLDFALIDNRSLLSAFRELCYIQKNSSYQMISYKNLGSEELGSVYESLLELQPNIKIEAGHFELKSLSGNQRKTTASYYTPTSLVNSLLDSALLPLINDILQNSEDKERELLKLKICDPSCGSGHFLIAAAQLIASFLANIRAGEDSPSAMQKQKALRDVISSCIYGVDLNPMAVELCKISLWMEAIEPGKPLSFLDHRILCGNSLLGTTPELLYAGIPNNAFNDLEGDDPELIKVFRRENRETVDQLDIFGYDTNFVRNFEAVNEEALGFLQIGEDSLSDLESKAELYREHIHSDLYEKQRLPYDAWCAAFLWHIKPNGITPILNSTLTSILDNSENISDEQRKEIKRIAEEYKFFHWHLAFPDVFPTEINEENNTIQIKDGVGFDCVLGNPPWEVNELKEQEWFNGKNEDIAKAPGDKRKNMIISLKIDDPFLYHEYSLALRYFQGTSLIYNSDSGIYPLCGHGRINLYSIFAELNRYLINNKGRCGFIVPSGIATDYSNRFFFEDVINTNSLVSFYDFENRKKLFPAVISSMKFALLTINVPSKNFLAADMLFFAHDTADLKDENKRFQMNSKDFALFNPNTKTCPIFRNKAQAKLAEYIYRRLPILLNENDEINGNPWHIYFRQGLFNMTSASHLFKTKADLENDGARLKGNIFLGEETRYLPLYEAKMIHHFNHRFGDYNMLPSDSKSTQLPDVPIESLQNSDYEPLPRYWVEEEKVLARVERKQEFLIGFRDITNSTNERTFISSVIPFTAVGNKVPLFFSKHDEINLLCLFSSLCCFVFDYTLRLKMGGTSLNYYIMKQLPILPPSAFDPLKEIKLMPSDSNKEISLYDYIIKAVLELSYTSNSLRPFARSLGYEGDPFIWNEERRFHLRTDLDAIYFHLYLGSEAEFQEYLKADNNSLDRYFTCLEDVIDHVMESFPIVKRKDIAQHGSYLTKETILKKYQEFKPILAPNE